MKTICPTCRKDNRHRDTLSHFLLKHRPKCQGVCADDSFAMARHAVTLWYYDQRERAGALSRARAERDKGGGGVSDGAVSHAAGGVSSVTILSYHVMSCHVMSCHDKIGADSMPSPRFAGQDIPPSLRVLKKPLLHS